MDERERDSDFKGGKNGLNFACRPAMNGLLKLLVHIYKSFLHIKFLHIKLFKKKIFSHYFFF